MVHQLFQELLDLLATVPLLQQDFDFGHYSALQDVQLQEFDAFLGLFTVLIASQGSSSVIFGELVVPQAVCLVE